MKDLKLKMRNLHASQTLGWSWTSCATLPAGKEPHRLLFLRLFLLLWELKKIVCGHSSKAKSERDKEETGERTRNEEE
jgi:hypothetical protein